MDLGLRLAGAQPDARPGGRLLAAPGLGNDVITVRVALQSVEDIDEEVQQLLQRARAESL